MHSRKRTNDTIYANDGVDDFKHSNMVSFANIYQYNASIGSVYNLVASYVASDIPSGLCAVPLTV